MSEDAGDSGPNPEGRGGLAPGSDSKRTAGPEGLGAVVRDPNPFKPGRADGANQAVLREDPEKAGPDRGPGAILLSSLGLVILAGIIALALMPKDTTVTSKDILGDDVVLTEMPYDLELLNIEQLSDGRQIALFGDPGDLPAEEEMGSPKDKGDWGGHGGSGRSDWRSRRFGGGGMMSGTFNADSPWLNLEAGTEGDAPWQVALIRYPRGMAESKLRSEFGRLHFQDLSQLPESGGSTPLDTGYVIWNGYRLPFVKTRHFRKEDEKPIYHDAIRVNLTRGTHALVLYARWKPWQNASVDSLKPILASLQLEESTGTEFVNEAEN